MRLLLNAEATQTDIDDDVKVSGAAEAWGPKEGITRVLEGPDDQPQVYNCDVFVVAWTLQAGVCR